MTSQVTCGGLAAEQVVLGLGGCVDYEIRVTGDELTELVDLFAITTDDLVPPGAIRSERDLVISILGYLARGAGGEHHVESPDVITAFADRFDAAVTLGGSSVRAGLAMNRLGVPALLHLVCFNEYFARLLPAGVRYVSSGYDEAVFPHLIVQYAARTTIRIGEQTLSAPFPNRLIYVNDPANENLVIRDDLGDMLASASIFLVTGFNAIAEESVLTDRLLTVRRDLRRLPADALVYYEDADFHQPEFSRSVRDALLAAVSVYGLNEDELQSYVGRSVDLCSAPDVRAALTDLRRVIPVPILVVHTKYWAAAIGADAGRFAGALDSGLTAATARFRFGDEFTADELAATRTMRRGRGATTFAGQLERATEGLVCCRPGFEVDVAQPTTVGLGDTFVGGFLAALALDRRASDQ